MATIALIGYGSIARDLVSLLKPELDAGVLTLAGAVVRNETRLAGSGTRAISMSEACASSDLIIECAGVRAVERYGPAIIANANTLLVASVGALADSTLLDALESGPGRLLITNGAVGGLDLLRAAAGAGGLDAVTVTTSKLPESLIQPWMPEPLVAELRALEPDDSPRLLLEGSPADAITKFPQNVNVAVAVALAMRGWGGCSANPGDPVALRTGSLAAALQRVRVRILADPAATLSGHDIEAEGATGSYRFTIRNRPSARNPKSSALTAQSLAQDVREWLRWRGGA